MLIIVKVKRKKRLKNDGFRAGMGLKAKFSLLLVLFILIVMGSVNLFFALREKRILSKEIRLRGEAITRNVAANAEDPLGNKDDLLLANFVHDAKENNEGVVYCFITDSENKIWATTEKLQLNKIYTPPQGLEPLRDESILVQVYERLTGEEVYDIAAPVNIKETFIGEVHLGMSRDAIKKSIKETGKGMAIVTAVTLIGGVIGILILVSFIIGSLGKITEDIEAIGNGDLDRRIEIRRRDEIGRIAHSVKEMAIKLKVAREELVEKERMEKEMQIAREIQHTLLPQSIPETPGFQIDAYYESAKEVGGDYYDYIEIDKDHFGIVIADVSGKGVAGSLIMTMVRTIMRMEAIKNPSPHNLLSITNGVLRDDIPEGMFITLFYVSVDIPSGEITFSCAGHNPAFLYNSYTESMLILKPKGPPLGIPLYNEKEFASRLIEEKQIFNHSDILLLYTDGITEAMNKNKEQFGEERLKKLLSENGKKDVYELKKILLSALEDFTGGAPQSDDITFVLLKKV